jgi:5'-nucleotidase
MGYMPQRDYNFDVAAKFTAGLVRELIDNPLPDDTLLNINAPGVDPEGIDITKLGKRLYRDELKKVKREVDDGRTSYRIYGYEPGLDDQPDTDIGAIARGRITVTPLSLDWTHHDEIEGLRDRDFERLLGAASS